MRYFVFISFLILLLTNCSQKPEQYIEHINGYWEIEKVTLADGTKKEYKINETIDFIAINDSLNGFRKKMKPRLDGKYETSNAIESLQLKIESDSLNLYYTTKYSNWKETILMASSNKLQIVNQNNDVYLYKRFHPIIIE